MPKKILVVEDNATSRELLQIYLRTKGFLVVTAADGAEGLIVTREERPDLIIADLTMPKLDGLQMTSRIRAEPEVAHTPIVIYTAYGEHLAEAAMAAGVNGFFTKPFDLEELTESLSRMLTASEPIKE